LKNWG